MITIIIPIHKFTVETKKIFHERTLSSLEKFIREDTKIMIVCPNGVKEQITTDLDIEYVINEGTTDFQSQINLGAKSTTTEYFSVLEFDDTLPNSAYLDTAKQYITKSPDVSVFMPICGQVEDRNGEICFVTFSNVNSFSKMYFLKEKENPEIYKKYGKIDFEFMESYENISIDGCIIKTSDFISLGGLKKSIDIAFNFEFFLRLASQNKKIVIIPKLGYAHLIDRKDSLFDIFETTKTKNDIANSVELAKKEYHFTYERELV